jgi:hypothetical protein
MAAAHAQQCLFEHAEMFVSTISVTMTITCNYYFLTAHLLPIARFRVGQNVYIAGSSGDILGTSNWNAAVTSWYNEVQYMTTAAVTSLP